MSLSLPSGRFSALAWLALVLLLVGIIGTELGWGSRIRHALPQTKPQKIRPAVLPLQKDFDLLPIDRAYTEILARPLFVPGRHSLLPRVESFAHSSAPSAKRRKVALLPPPPPPPPKVQAQEQAVQEPPREKMRKGQFALDGIILTQGKNIALLREVSTRKTVRAELGEEINGMLVEKLEPDRITFKQDEEREVLILKVKTGPKAPAKQGMPARQGSVGVPQQSVVAPADGSAQAAVPAEPGAAVPAAPVAAVPAPPAAVADGDPTTPSFVERRRALRQRSAQ